MQQLQQPNVLLTLWCSGLVFAAWVLDGVFGWGGAEPVAAAVSAICGFSAIRSRLESPSPSVAQAAVAAAAAAAQAAVNGTPAAGLPVVQSQPAVTAPQPVATATRSTPSAVILAALAGPSGWFALAAGFLAGGAA